MFIEDDADEMILIIEKVFTQMAEDYLLSQKEAENIIDCLKDDLTGNTLKDMFASSDRKAFAHNLLIGHTEAEVKKRKKIKLPSTSSMQKSLKLFLRKEKVRVVNELPAAIQRAFSTISISVCEGWFHASGYMH